MKNALITTILVLTIVAVILIIRVNLPGIKYDEVADNARTEYLMNDDVNLTNIEFIRGAEHAAEAAVKEARSDEVIRNFLTKFILILMIFICSIASLCVIEGKGQKCLPS